MDLESLHYPLKLSIFQDLSYPDIINLCLTNSYFKDFCHSDVAKPIILRAKLNYETILYQPFIEHEYRNRWNNYVSIDEPKIGSIIQRTDYFSGRKSLYVVTKLLSKKLYIRPAFSYDDDADEFINLGYIVNRAKVRLVRKLSQSDIQFNSDIPEEEIYLGRDDQWRFSNGDYGQFYFIGKDDRLYI